MSLLEKPEILYGIVGAAVGGIAKPFWKYFFENFNLPGRKRDLFEGKWGGVAVEFDGNCFVRVFDHFKLKRARSEGQKMEFKGEMDSDGPGFHREWNITGTYHKNWKTLVIIYYGVEPEDRKSVGAYILERSPTDDFKGYWLGYDDKLGRLLAAPYILTKRTTQLEAVYQENKDWFEHLACNLPPRLVMDDAFRWKELMLILAKDTRSSAIP